MTLVAGERVRQLARLAVNTLTVWNVKGHPGDATGEVAEPAQCSLMRTTSLSLETHLFVFQGIDRAWPAPGSASAPARLKLGWEGGPGSVYIWEPGIGVHVGDRDRAGATAWAGFF